MEDDDIEILDIFNEKKETVTPVTRVEKFEKVEEPVIEKKPTKKKSIKYSN